MNESGTNGAECHGKGASGRKVVAAMLSLVNARGLELHYVKMLHEPSFVAVLLYVSETVVWREKERSRIGAVQMDNHRGFLCMRMKRLMKLFSDGSAIWKEWRMIGLLKGYVWGKCMGSRLVGRPRKEWIDSVNDFLKKRRF